MATNTKLLLMEDVEHLGRRGDLVTVKPGYARNFLVPRSLAVVADKHTLTKQARLQEERKLKASEDRKDAEQVASRLVSTVLTIEVKVDHEGHMYGSVSAADIARLLEEQANIVLDKRAIALAHAIKTTGVHTVEFKLKEGIQAQAILKIVAEGAIDQVEAPAAAAE